MAAPEIVEHYAEGHEEHRLTRALGRLEWLRTWEVLARYLPEPPARVLDVGGGTGVYGLALAARGYEVRLVDVVPLHVERARALSRASATPLASADVGDARRLEQPDASADVMLLLGPLYHLTEAADRQLALAEARRALAPGGLLVAAYISRFASACDGIQEGKVRDASFVRIVERDLTDGVHQNPAKRADGFTTSYFHRPDEIAPELERAGLCVEAVLAVEGPGWVNESLDGLLDDEDARQRLLHLLRLVEHEPSLLGASPHLLAIARG